MSMGLYRRAKAKDKPWHYDFKFQGVRYQGSTLTSNRGEAEIFLASIRADLARGVFNVPGKGVRFDEAAEKYLEYASINKASGSSEPYHVRKHLVPHFGAIPLNSISLETCERYKHKRLDAGATRATINRELTTLKSILKYAAEAKLAREGLGPCAKYFKGVKSREKFAITLDELEKLYAACQLLEIRVRAEYLGDLIIVLVSTGLRPSEALTLERADVDFAARRIRVRKSKTPTRERLVPMHDTAVQALQRLLERTNCQWVFPSPRKPGHRIQDFGKAFEKAVKLAGIRRITPYHLAPHLSDVDGCHVNATLRSGQDRWPLPRTAHGNVFAPGVAGKARSD